MTRIAVTFAALAIAASATVAAQEMPTPQVFRGSPFQKGQWKMEILEMDAKGREQAHGMPGAMTICMDDIRQMGRNQDGPGGKDRSDCKIKLLKDTATVAVMEATCPDGTTRTTLTRESEKSYLMQAAGTSRGESYAMKARYTYEGAQCTQSGAGMGMGAAGPGAGMGANKNSPQCQQAQAQLGSMNPGAMCANAGANRAMCEQNILRMKSQLEAMCR